MKPNQVTFKVSGRFALFTDPMTKIGGEKSTLMIPTAEALKGIVSSVYWKPSILWIIDEATVLNPIRTERKGIRPIKYYGGGNDLAYYTYLSNVSYIVKAHFEFNPYRPDLKQDWNEHKHYGIAKRCIEKGGRRDVFLGARECQAYVEPVTGEEQSCYSDLEQMDFGLMFHSFVYPDQNGTNQLEALFWYPKMERGVIRYCKQEDCAQRIPVREMKPKRFDSSNFSGLQEPGLLEGYQEGGSTQ